MLFLTFRIRKNCILKTPSYMDRRTETNIGNEPCTSQISPLCTEVHTVGVFISVRSIRLVPARALDLGRPYFLWDIIYAVPMRKVEQSCRTNCLSLQDPVVTVHTARGEERDNIGREERDCELPAFLECTCGVTRGRTCRQGGRSNPIQPHVARSYPSGLHTTDVTRERLP